MEAAYVEIQKIGRWKKIVALLSIGHSMEMRDLEGVMGGRNQASSVANVLRFMGLVEKRYGKLFKTPKGNALVEHVTTIGGIDKDELRRTLLDAEGVMDF